ncbi:Hypothetical protein AKI40_0559 [Enterobacter sp. FY-07]|nr:Hypothetical protein AKI40_0559 [Enterobacter sp. FY-07]
MSTGPENSVITERLLAATAMKTSRYIQYLLLPDLIDRSDVELTTRAYCHSRLKSKQKMNNPSHLGRKLDDSLPDFAGFVVRGFWKC